MFREIRDSKQVLPGNDKAAGPEQLPGDGDNEQGQCETDGGAETITDGREHRVLKAENFGPPEKVSVYRD